jgi:hypothetical protein
VPPPKLKMVGWLVEEAPSLRPKEPLGLPPIPGAEEEEPPLLEFDEREDQPSRIREEKEVLEYYGRRRDKLNKYIDNLFDDIPRELTGKEMDRALRLLTEARDVLAERPRQFDEAEYKVARAGAIIENRRHIRHGSSTYGNSILVYEIAWFLLLFAGFVFSQGVLRFLSAAIDINFFGPFWNSMMWGGIGGVVGALYSLHWHVATQQDFNKYYSMSYVVQPIMGLILGGAIYLIISAGFLGIQVASETAGTTAAVVYQLFPSLIAFVAGFRQKLVYELIDLIVKRITPNPEAEYKKTEKAREEAEEAAEEEETAPPTPKPQEGEEEGSAS